MRDINKVLVTGITGYIGGSIALALRDAGYQVAGTFRKPQDAHRIHSEGMQAVSCDLQQHEKYDFQTALASCDAVIHAAECDDVSIAAFIINQLRGTGKTLIYTSGAGYLANHRRHAAVRQVMHEDIPCRSGGVFPDRVRINNAILRANQSHVRSMVMVPAMVYGVGRFINVKSKQLPALEQASAELNHGVYIGDGENSWSNVHIDDLVSLYLLALKNAKSGSLFYVENGISSFRQIGEALHQRMKFRGKAIGLSPAVAADRWGEMMSRVGLSSDCRINADKARQMLGWEPLHHDITHWITQNA